MRNKSIFTFIIYGLIGLAGFGLLMQLFTNSKNFLISIAITLLFTLAILGLFYYFVLGRRNSSEEKKYKQAVKQSKSKYSKDNSKIAVKNQSHSNPLKKNSKKKTSHLRVIDGNKTKRKKRASN